MEMINHKLRELNQSSLTRLSHASSVVFSAVRVSWEDGERTVGSAIGPRINDVFIVQTPTSTLGRGNPQQHSQYTLIVRTENFTDYVVRTSTLDIEVAPLDGAYTTVASMSLAYLLKNFLAYTTDVLTHSDEHTDIDLTSSRLHSQSHVYPTRYQMLQNDSPEVITHYRSVVSLNFFSRMLQALISKFHRGLGFYDEAVTQRVMTAWLTATHGETPEFVVRVDPYGQFSLVIIDYSILGIRKSSWHLVKRTSTDIAIRRREEDGRWVVKRFEASKNRQLTATDASCDTTDPSLPQNARCDAKAADDASHIRVINIPLDWESTPNYSLYSSYLDFSDDDDDGPPVYRSSSATEPQPSVYTAKMNAGSVHSETDSYDEMYRLLSQCTRANAPITITDCFYVVQSDIGRINDTAVTNRVSMMMDFFKARAQEVASIHEQMKALLTH